MIGAMQPLLSIVTVSLNAAASIEDTIASVALQRVDFDVEHVCVDGGSTDATRSIIDRWAARSNRIVRVYEPDTGIYDAMNKGLRAAHGQYVLYLNADDFLVAPDTLAGVFAGLTGRAGEDPPDLILGDAVMGRLGHWGAWRHRLAPRVLGRWPGLGLYPLHQAQFTKCSLLIAVGGFSTGMRIAADVAQFYDLEQQFPLSVRFIRRDVAFMRAGGAANAGVRAMVRGTLELFRHLSATRSPLRAAGMVLIKTLQSLAEVRCGRCPHARWFATAIASQSPPAAYAERLAER
jgi:glycosyltransferase involved in cell wall biosynthesis